ncbi:hypothetical protein APHAL10511_007171 [Amanita phalloides]|nr:hypothetical protein APHAL10511_007171 [Amanita phalloides]
MASSPSQQYAFRAQKLIGLVGGTPDYVPLPTFVAPDEPARTSIYSADGRLYAYALPAVVRIFQAEGAQVLQELPVPNVIELHFSPRGTYLSTWERPVKSEDGAQYKNLRVFSVSTGEELISFSQKSQEGWNLQYTISESHAIRLVGSEIQVYRPADWSHGIIDKLKIEGATSISLSPGLNPSVAVFAAERKGAPASIKVYGLLTLNSPPTCQKTFFKADRSQIKWNTLGTQVLLLTQTDVDKSNKSYYGETRLYLLSAAGNFDCRVNLDKDGPIHDLAWSPNSKEFGVVYGFMPAKTMLFDHRVRTLHDFGSSPYNFISFNPQARLVALAGFGNLAGKIDIFDRRTLSRVCTIDAPNTSHCEWSPDGRFLLTATLSPRLRVDNGIKIWHCTGPLLHVQMVDDLYQASWRPQPVDSVPQFGQALPPAPLPSESVGVYEASTKKPSTVKPAGAYRPPGARGLATPSIYKREDEGGVPHLSTNSGGSGTTTPTRGHRGGVAPGAPGYGQAANGTNGRRHVPGAPSSSGGATSDFYEKKSKKRKGSKKEGAENGDVGEAGVIAAVTTNGKGNDMPEAEGDVTRTLEEAGGLDATAKKIRNLNKKLKAIEELKEKAKRGERLEATQVRKIEGEAEIRRELESLESYHHDIPLFIMPPVPPISPATNRPTPPSYIHTDHFHFIDNAGRTLLLRGVNLSGSSKAPVDRPSYLREGFWESAENGGESFIGRPLNLDDGSADVHLARLSGWGFNLLRFPVTWEALEHDGPGKYDYEFMHYIIRVLHKCREYGFRVYIDPHQDTWSRFSGGSGAPFWTLAACGIDPRNITTTQAAILHCEYPQTYEPNPAELPAMIWSTNYGRLLSQTLFTLFFAGRDFAPKCIIDGQNIQDYLQSHYIEAVGRLADLICQTDPDLLDDCVIGWDTMNEPFEGFVGWEDLNQNPHKQGTTLKKGTYPTPAQSFRLGMGQAQKVDNFKFGALGPSRDGSVTIDPKGHKVWANMEGETVDGVSAKWGWHRDVTKWPLGTCIWALHGVWDTQTGFVNRPDYFRFQPETGTQVHFIADYWRPHALAYARRIRRAHPDAILFIQPPVFAQPPTVTEEVLKGRCAYTGHYYDGLTLVTRHWNWFNADALGLLRGKYSSALQAVKIGESAIRKSLQEQLGVLKDDAKILGPYPTVIGEIGIPFDMDGKRSYGWTDGGKYRGDYSRQERALDASLNACDGNNVLNWTAWTYCPDHDHNWGDGWNMEDLSIWSADDMEVEQTDEETFSDDMKPIPSGSTTSLDIPIVYPATDTINLKQRPNPAGWHPNPYVFLTDGARAVRAFSRPWPRKIVGRPKHIAFNIKEAHFKLTVIVKSEDKLNLAATNEANPATEIYIPLVHYAMDKWLPTELRSQTAGNHTLSGSNTPVSSHLTSETASILTSSSDTISAGLRAIVEKDLVDIDVTVSAGRWSVEGQMLKWWYPVPQEEEEDQELVIEVKRRGSAIYVNENQWSWLDALCPNCCCVM